MCVSLDNSTAIHVHAYIHTHWTKVESYRGHRTHTESYKWYEGEWVVVASPEHRCELT